MLSVTHGLISTPTEIVEAYRKVWPLRLSHSSLNLLHECERKFQIEKLLAGPEDKEESAHFSFGKSVGTAVATYLVTKDKDQALFQGWLAYWPVVESDAKNQVTAMAAIMGSFTALDGILALYDVAEFNGQPAVELSFKLAINETKYFVGHIDVVLRHKVTGKYFILEVKTTGLQLLDLKPAYQHSGQALGYSIALDKIVGEKLSTYGVLYFVVQLPHVKSQTYACRYHTFEFPKTLVDRLNWFVSLGLDVQHLEAMESMNIFPKRGASCIRFNKTCRHFGICSLQNFDQPKEQKEDPIEYTFTYDLEELIEEHIERIQNMPVIPPTSNIMDVDALL